MAAEFLHDKQLPSLIIIQINNPEFQINDPEYLCVYFERSPILLLKFAVHLIGHLVLNLATAWNGLGAKINPKTGSAEGIGWLSDFVNVNFCSNLVKIMKSSALARVSPKQYLLPAKQ